ncbi:MAG: putative 2OG-Fe(II) oxygenase [Rhizomicrobium sp.]
MATPKPQIRSMFATPVCVHFMPIAQEINAELRPLVIEKMTANGAADSHGQGWHSAPDFESWGGGAAQTLFRVLRELADSVTATRGGGRVTLEWRITAIAVVRQKGDYAALIARPGTMWSGIYYVDDGYAKSDDETLGGECELADPRGALPAMVAPHLSFRIPGGVAAGHVETIRPQTGLILLHPSWQPRGERRFDGTGQRIAIEFDLMPPPGPL